jgi:hypothetical protein
MSLKAVTAAMHRTDAMPPAARAETPLPDETTRWA